jgi:NAD(P)-dependent dehydrogenase (short-subunit alcohol dehydrogenase family)
MSRPEGTAAIVTGAAGGLGSAVVATLLDAGVAVAAVDINADGLEALAKAHPARPMECIRADVTDRAALAAAVGQVARHVGQPLILVNNAGLTDLAAFITDVGDELWDLEMAVHATAAFRWTRECLPAMQRARWGRVVNVSSVAASMGDVAHVAYSSAKAALLGLTRSTALENARFGITANAVLPGMIRTPAYTRIRADVRDRVEARTAMKRSGEAPEVASLIGYLASDGASYLTGQSIAVDGGLGLFVF